MQLTFKTYSFSTKTKKVIVTEKKLLVEDLVDLMLIHLEIRSNTNVV